MVSACEEPVVQNADHPQLTFGNADGENDNVLPAAIENDPPSTEVVGTVVMPVGYTKIVAVPGL